MRLVIAEKPVLARDIARAVCGRGVPQDARLPISGRGYTVVACAGHLLELVEPGQVDPRWGEPWTEDAMPVQVDDWPKRPIPGKEGLVEEIGRLVARADEVICAGDPDDEGQLIVDELLDWLGYSGPASRVYVNDSIEKNIRKAFSELRDNDACRGAGRAAYARQMADMCFGVNESRLAALRLHANVSIGRVQTPTLGLVVRRDEQIEGHVARPYFEPVADVEVGGRVLSFRFKPDGEALAGERHLFSREVADEVALALESAEVDVVAAVGVEEKQPPLPYNLTTLISDMSRRFKMGAARTQQVTQDLRDKFKAITYNRTDCQFLKEEHYLEAPAVLGCALGNLGVSAELDFSVRSRAFDDSAVDAHHAIIPQETPVDVAEMTGDELAVYRSIVVRYAMQFAGPCRSEVSRSSFPAPHGTFEHVARRELEAGWKAIQPPGADDDDDAAAAPADGWLDGGRYRSRVESVECVEKRTSPPKPYTEGTLVADMASIAKYVTDARVRDVLKRKDDGKRGEHGGIGTTATRAAIIEKLKSRGFIEESRGKVRSTDRGRAFYHLVPADISGADVTARWWTIQQDIALGKADVNAVQRDVVAVFASHRDTAYLGKAVPRAGMKRVGKCPVCGADVLMGKSAGGGKAYFTCSSNRSVKQQDGTFKRVEGCGFKLFGFGGKRLTEKQAQRLLLGKTIALKGCTSKSGRKYDCKVRLGAGGRIEPLFGDARKTGGSGARRGRR